MKKFIAIFMFLILAIGLVACGDTESSSASGDKAEKKTEKKVDKKKKQEKKYKVGDTAEVAGVKFTLKAVSLTEERNEFDDTDPAEVVKIEYEMENTSDEEVSYGMDLQVYDGTGNKTESYPNDNSMGSIKSGKKVQGNAYYGIEKGPIEIYFQPMVSFDKDAIFEADVK